MKIKLVNPIHPNIDQIKPQFEECLNNGLVTNNSKYVKLFEKEIKKYLGTNQKPLVFCNGEMALFNLIHAWKEYLGFNSHNSFKVIVPSFTFSGTVNAIVANNLFPVFCDIDDTMTIDLNKIDKVDTDVKMVIAVGSYGTLPNIEKLLDFCKQNNLVLILDNAPSFGVKYKNKFSSNYKISEIWSFHATKVLSTMEGGGAVSYEKCIMEKLEYLRNFGQKELIRGNIISPGLNSKMQEISAIVGIHNLNNYNKILLERNEIIKKYAYIFHGLVKANKITVMRVGKGISCNYTNYPIILNNDAGDFVKYMESKNIQVRRYYTAVHMLDYYKGRYFEYNLDYTNQIKDKVIALPLHSGMTDNKIEYLFNSVNHYFD